MFQFILRRVLPEGSNPSHPQVRRRCGLAAGGIGVALNLTLFLGKLCAGALTGAISVTADAFNNLSDAAGSVVTLAGFRMAGRRADAEHPFGHGRAEYLAGLAVSLLILLVGVELVQGSVGKILRPEPAVFSVLAVALLGLSIGVKLWMGWFYAAMGRRAQSPTLAAAAADARSDVLATSAVLAGLAASHFFHVQLDGWLGLAVAALGWAMVKLHGFLYAGAAAGDRTLFACYIAFWIFLVVLCGAAAYIFPVLSRFTFGVGGLLAASVKLALAHPLTTLLLGLLTVGCVLLCVEFWMWMVWLVLPSVWALLASLLLERVFRPFMEEQGEAEGTVPELDDEEE